MKNVAYKKIPYPPKMTAYIAVLLFGIQTVPASSIEKKKGFHLEC